MLTRILGVLEKFNRFVAMICRKLIIALVAALAVILVAAVIFRYGLNSSISWAEEGCKYLMVWLTFLGTPIALREFAHINIDLILKILPGRASQFMHLLINLIILFTMSVIFWYGIKFTQLGMRQVASSFNLSMFYMYVAVPLGAGLTCIVAIEHVLRAMRGVIDPKQGIVDNSTESEYAV